MFSHIFVFICISTNFTIFAKKTFEKTQYPNGAATCALDQPSLVIPLDEMLLGKSSSESCTYPPEVFCAWKCTLDPNCSNFNYRNVQQRSCELFYYTPTNCSFVEGCYHSQVKGLQCCQKFDILENCTDSSNGVSIYVGQYVNITCSVTYSGVIEPSLLWTDGEGQPVQNGKTFRSDSTVMSIIEIPGFIPSIRKFRCSISTKDSSRNVTNASILWESNPIPVTGLSPHCTDNSTNGTVLVGDQVQITCTVDYFGDLSPSLQWNDSNGHPINNATTQVNPTNLTSVIVVPAYLPIVNPMTFTTFIPNSPNYTYSCHSSSIDVDCPEEFESLSGSSTCYKILFETLDWTTAREKCQQLRSGSYMAMITSKQEQTAITGYLDAKLSSIDSGQTGKCTWIIDPSQTGKCIWISGIRLKTNDCSSSFVWEPSPDKIIPFDYTNWVQGVPLCYDAEANCVNLIKFNNYNYFIYKWINTKCDKTLCVLCEFGPM